MLLAAKLFCIKLGVEQGCFLYPFIWIKKKKKQLEKHFLTDN